MLLKKLAHIFIGLALLSLQAANGQSLVETLGQFIASDSSNYDAKSIKSATEAEFLINFFERLDKETFDPTNPEISKTAKKIADRTSSTIAKGLKNSDLELTTKEKLFAHNQLKFMTTLLLRINGLSDQSKQDILKAHRLISKIFHTSFTAKAFNAFYSKTGKIFTCLGLISATAGTFLIMATTVYASSIAKRVDGALKGFEKLGKASADATDFVATNIAPQLKTLIEKELKTTDDETEGTFTDKILRALHPLVLMNYAGAWLGTLPHQGAINLALIGATIAKGAVPTNIPEDQIPEFEPARNDAAVDSSTSTTEDGYNPCSTISTQVGTEDLPSFPITPDNSTDGGGI